MTSLARSVAPSPRSGWARAAATALTLVSLASCSVEDSSGDAASPATTASPATAPTPTPPATGASGGGDGGASLGQVSVRLEEVAQLEGALAMAAPEGGDTLYVATQSGTVHALRDGRVDPEPVLDITDEVVDQGFEQGLLGVVISPDRQSMYVNLTNLDENTSIREYQLRDGRAVEDSMRELMVIEDFAVNHNGGQMTFGPDGMLYIATGDGGGAGDPQRTAQDLGSLLGKILRIDPQPSGDRPYTIPPDNPFVDREGARGEIWAYGLRNPWRFSFDEATGDMWIGDVGQNEREEVDVIPAGSGGGQNFEWSLMEGTLEFNGSAPENGVPPVLEYGREGEACSVIGGAVYRGQQIPGLQGAYVYGDFCAGWVRAVQTRDGRPVGEPRDLGIDVPQLSAFGTDQQGELYALSLDGGVFRVVGG